MEDGSYGIIADESIDSHATNSHKINNLIK